VHPLAVKALADAFLTTISVVYLSGPMTGREKWNFPAFEAAAMALRSIGLTVLSPHEKDLAAGFDPASDGAGFDLKAALEEDVDAVLVADAVVVLPEWETSPGAVIEVTVAEAMGKPIIPIEVALLRDTPADPNFIHPPAAATA
jgi:nucleoside 2-deoxyribosyltransferase